MGRLLAATMLGVFAGCQAEPSKEAAPEASSQGITAATNNCVSRFEGITHCATGNAELESTDEGLVITGLADLEQDGIVGAVGQAESWRQRSRIAFGEGNEGVALYGRSGDQVISTLRMALDEPGVLRMLPTFTGSPGGSTYTITVRNHGEPTAAYQVVTIDGSGWKLYLKEQRELEILLREAFHREEGGLLSEGSSPGACVWTVNLEEGWFQLNLDDGTEVIGDEIEFVEQLADGAYPYSSFTHIGMTAAVDKVTILDESVTLNSK